MAIRNVMIYRDHMTYTDEHGKLQLEFDPKKIEAMTDGAVKAGSFIRPPDPDPGFYTPSAYQRERDRDGWTAYRDWRNKTLYGYPSTNKFYE